MAGSCKGSASSVTHRSLSSAVPSEAAMGEHLVSEASKCYTHAISPLTAGTLCSERGKNQHEHIKYHVLYTVLFCLVV